MSAKLSWTEAQINRLRELVFQGKSCGDIADILITEFDRNFTRNAIVGKISRLRESTKDEKFRAGLSVGRLHIPKGMGTSRNSQSIQRLLEWKRTHGWTTKPKNAGAAISSVRGKNSWSDGSPLSATESRLRKAKRREAAMQMMRHHIVCAGDACHFTDRPDYGSHFHTHCCWPVYEDGAPYSEKNSCCNRVEAGKPYCAAHQKIATEYVAAPFKQLPNRKGAVTIVPHHWKRDSWRAA